MDIQGEREHEMAESVLTSQTPDEILDRAAKAMAEHLHAINNLYAQKASTPWNELAEFQREYAIESARHAFKTTSLSYITKETKRLHDALSEALDDLLESAEAKLRSYKK